MILISASIEIFPVALLAGLAILLFILNALTQILLLQNSIYLSYNTLIISELSGCASGSKS
jgi:hypothetical protein